MKPRRPSPLLPACLALVVLAACSSLPGEQAEKPVHQRANSGKEMAALGDESLAAGNYAQAETYYHKSLDANYAVDNQEGVAESANSLGNLYLSVKDFVAAEKYYREAMSAARRANSPLLQAKTFSNQAKAALAQANPDQALTLLAQAEALLPPGNPRTLAVIQHNRGNALLAKADLAGAKTSFTSALNLNIAAGALRERAANLYMLARLEHRGGRHAEARERLLQALAIDKESESGRGIADDLFALYQVDLALGKPALAYDWLIRSFRSNLANNHATQVERDLQLLVVLAGQLDYAEDKATWQGYLQKLKATAPVTPAGKQGGQ